MRIVTWNVRNATAKSAAWPLLIGLSPDIALLQEVRGFSEEIEAQFDIKFEYATTQAMKR